MKFFYNALLIIGLGLSLPMIMWRRFKYKKYKGHVLERLGLKLPSFLSPSNVDRIWIHCVSLGETKAVSSLVKKIQKERPQCEIFFSSSTETGLAEGEKFSPSFTSCFLLPIDFSWTISSLFKKMQPDLVILVEGDFWYNLLRLAPKVVLVNGKISEKSVKRFGFFHFFAKKLFSYVKLFCVQSSLYKERFESLGIPRDTIVVTGNLKLDQVIKAINPEEWQQKMGLSQKDRVIIVASTHSPEEDELLESLTPLFKKFPDLKLFLVPRHPERFDVVKSLLAKKSLSFACYSDPDLATKNVDVILVDAMGILGSCLQLSELAIVAGSFGSKLGGHNIFEPVSLGIPVLFGPHMHSQEDLKRLVLEAGAGKQVSLSELGQVVENFLETPPIAMKKAAFKLAQEMQGSTERTWGVLQKFLS